MAEQTEEKQQPDKPGHNAPAGRKEDWFEFKQYVTSLADNLLIAPAPFTLGVFGPWGSGKTGMMRLLQEELEKPISGEPRKLLTIWFDAWKYGREETIWRGLLVHTFAELQAHLEAKLKDDSLDEAHKLKLKDALKQLDELSQSLYRTVTVTTPGNLTIDWGQAGKAGVKLALPLVNQVVPGVGLIGKLGSLFGSAEKEASDDSKAGDVNIDDKAVNELLKVFRREEQKQYIEQVRFLDQFHERFAQAVQLAVDSGAVDRLVFFIDDLDRCLPEKAVEVLESIKLFLGNKHCLFVVGVDEEVIHRGIAHRYGDMFKEHENGVSEQQRRFREEYLEKIVQLAFPLPPIHRDLLDGYVGAHLTPLAERPEENGWVQQLFAEGLPRNPRKLLRACELFNLLWQVGEKRELEIYPDILARLVAIQLRDTALARAVAQPYQSGILSGLEKFWDERDSVRTQSDTTSDSGERVARKPEKLIAPYTEYDWLNRLLRCELPQRRSIGQLSGPELMRHIELISFETNEEAERRRHEIGLAALAKLRDQIKAATPSLVDKQLLERLLAEELSEIESAVNELEEAQYPDYRAALFEVFTSESIPTCRRISAGDALGYIGDPRFLDGEPWRRNDYWVQIPAGDFWCGSTDDDEDADDDEEPQHVVTLNAFDIARWPVTNAEYVRFVQSVQIDPPKHWRNRLDPPRGLSNHPVVHVSREDAEHYVDWLNQQSDVDGRVFLPSEAQWERAARGPKLWGGKENKRRWPWGDEAKPFGDFANAEMALARTTPVGSHPRGATPDGVLDMAGNVWEWCRDGMRKYRATEELNPEGPLDGGSRVLRGGSWYYDESYCRVAYRNQYPCDFSRNGFGFRCARVQK